VWDHDVIYGAGTSDDPFNRIYSITNLPMMNRCLFAFFNGCHTADSDGVNDLLTASLDKGVQSAMGFEDEVTALLAEDFAAYFWHYALDKGWMVVLATNAALADLEDKYFGVTGGCESWVLHGDIATVLRPARYGH